MKTRFSLRRSAAASSLSATGVLLLLPATAPAAPGSLPTAAQARAQRAQAKRAQAQQVTNALTQYLRRRISSPGGSMQLRVVPSARAAQGYFSEVFIAAKPAQIKDLRFSELTLHARNVRLHVPELLQKRKLRTISSQTSLRAVITESEVTQALARGQDSADKGLRVKFLGNSVRVNGRWKWSWFSGPIEAIGKLRLGSDHTVLAEISSLKLNGSQVPPGVRNKFTQKINPLLSYEDLPFKPPFKSLIFQGTRAVIKA